MTDLQEIAAAHHRSTIIVTLNPFLELLKDQKQHLNQTNWLKAVRTMMFRIIETPDQYLPTDLPRSEETTGMIRSIFHELILSQTPFQIQN